jgi:peptidoglycan/LPS O-acetylase OafA/YrhL
MNAALSTYLNLLRLVAALVVVLSHFAYPRFTDGDWLWVRELNLGSDAVVVFFVLSGFVISLTAAQKDHTLGAFAFARASRLISVALPALLLGWVLDQWGAAKAPGDYAVPFYNPLPLWEQVLRGLSFTNEWGGLATRLGSNGPYWSLSYEAAYYALFAVGFYLSGPRRGVLLLSGALLVGVNILLLMPAWLMGVWVYRRLAHGHVLRDATAVLFAVLPVLLYLLALRFALPEVLRLHLQPHLSAHALRYSDEYLWNALLGGMVGIHLLGVAQLLRGIDLALIERPVAWLAGASFSIYLIHYPLLQALHAARPDLSHAGLFGLTLFGCFAFAQLFERPLALWRRLALATVHGRAAPVTG